MSLPVYTTGIRNTEYVFGPNKQKQTAGIILQVKGFYPPSAKAINNLALTDLRDALATIPFFAKLTLEQRQSWLQQHATSDNDLYLNEVELHIRFVHMSAKNFFQTKLDSATITRLVEGNPNDPEGYWPISYVYSLFPRKPGSRAKRTTLVFRPGNWHIYVPKYKVNNYSGYYFDFTHFTLQQNTITNNLGNIHVLALPNTALKQIAVLTQTRENPWSLQHLFTLLRTLANYDNLLAIAKLLQWMPPSMYKSLIQKLIRTRCHTVVFQEQTYNSRDVLVCAFIMLLLHGGALVPNLNKFVSGLESACKRLAVTICEDSYSPDANGILSLYLAALLVQTDRNWRPNDQLILYWCNLMLGCLGENKLFAYDWHNVDLSKVTNNISAWSLNYFVLAELKSFASDISMLASIAENRGQARQPITDLRLEPMPLVHALDHHSFADLAHYVPYKLVAAEKNYQALFQQIWQRVVGINPRKDTVILADKHITMAEYLHLMPTDEFVQDIRQAQLNMWLCYSTSPSIRAELANFHSNFSYNLDASWLAGLIGPIKSKYKGRELIAVLSANNIAEIKVIKRPARSKKETAADIGPAEKTAAIQHIENLLAHGIKLQHVPSSVKFLQAATVYKREDNYYVELNNELIPWDSARLLRYKVAVHAALNYNLHNAIRYTGNGVDMASSNILPSILQRYDSATIQRLLMYINNYREKIGLFRVARSGEGAYYQISTHDTAVQHLLAELAVAYPAGLQLNNNVFTVLNGTIMWNIRDYFLQYIYQQRQVCRWPAQGPDDRPRYEHQEQALVRMIGRQQKGKRGHLMWIGTGMGKTIILLDYINYLIQQQYMPKYVIYTLPPSAIDNLQVELSRRNIAYKLLDARQTASADAKTIQPYVFNIVRHDHAKREPLRANIMSIISQAILVVDEFDECMNETIRTTAILAMARLAYDMVAMSATIIRDEHHDKLIQWLEQAVEFEVNKFNYWVGVAAIVSSTATTGVSVERVVKSVQLTEPLLSAYNEVVPESMGGSARELNFPQAVQLSYQATTKSLIEYILYYVNFNEGVFVVVRNRKSQIEIKEQLLQAGLNEYSIVLFSNDVQITLDSSYTGPVKVVITTPRHARGYTLTKFRIMLQGVYFSNQATREQLEGRINRLGQTSNAIRIITLHAGILSYIWQKYEKVRSLVRALRGFAEEASLDYKLAEDTLHSVM